MPKPSIPHYGVLIDRGNGRYQFYRGWDQIFIARADAEKLLAEANRKFPAAKLTSVTGEAELQRLGWVANG
jgi:hypothetical protein